MTGKPEYQIVNGLRVPVFFDPDIVRSAMEYIPREDDIVVSSYPKCGASFVSQIVHLILRNGKQLLSAEEYFSSIPLLEMIGTENLSCLPSPHCIKTHIPPNKMQYTKHAKYIYVARHFSECLVSYYKHTKMFPAYFFTDGTFNEFLNLFLKGEVGYGGYFEHFNSGIGDWSYYGNRLFITYESITVNLKDAVIGIAKFLGEEYCTNLLDSRERVLKDILFNISSYMKCTADDFWREMFLEKLLTGKCQIHFPIAEKYANVMKKAETDGHYLTDILDEIIPFKRSTKKKLNKYLLKYVWEDDNCSDFLYFKKKQLSC